MKDAVLFPYGGSIRRDSELSGKDKDEGTGDIGDDSKQDITNTGSGSDFGYPALGSGYEVIEDD